MDYGWIVLVFVLWALGVALTLVLLSMASDQDRVARRSEERIVSFSDVPIIGPGRG